MNFKFTKRKVVWSIIIAVLLLYILLTLFFAVSGDYFLDLDEILDISSLWFGAFIYLPLIIIFVVSYVIWSLIQKSRINKKK